MLINYYKSSYFFHYFTLFVISFLMWAGAFFIPKPMFIEAAPTSPLYNLFYFWLADLPLISTSIAFLLLIAEAFLLNFVLINNQLIPKNSMVPAITFIVFMSSGANLLNLYPALLAMPMLIAIVHILLAAYDKKELIKTSFSLGLLVSIASMAYLPSILIIPVIWLAFLVYSISSLREWMIVLIGFTIPYLYLFTWQFINDRLIEFLTGYWEYFTGMFQTVLIFDTIQIVIWAVIIVLLLMPAMSRILSTLNTFNISTRKKISVVTWLTFVSAIMIFSAGIIGYNIVIFLPAAIFISSYFTIHKRSAWNELVFLVLILGIIVHNFLVR